MKRAYPFLKIPQEPIKPEKYHTITEIIHSIHLYDDNDDRRDASIKLSELIEKFPNINHDNIIVRVDDYNLEFLLEEKEENSNYENEFSAYQIKLKKYKEDYQKYLKDKEEQDKQKKFCRLNKIILEINKLKLEKEKILEEGL